MTDAKQEVKNQLLESAEVKKKVADELGDKIVEVADRIVNAYKKGGKVLLFGNGGSAADAQHIEGELVHQFEMTKRHALGAISLTTNTSVMTAIINDWSAEQIFERQVEALANKEDVVIGLSTSGNAMNVLRGIEEAKKIGAYTIAFLGKDGGKIRDVADLSLVVPSQRTARIQEAHITIGHIICAIIEKELFEDEK